MLYNENDNFLSIPPTDAQLQRMKNATADFVMGEKFPYDILVASIECITKLSQYCIDGLGSEKWAGIERKLHPTDIEVELYKIKNAIDKSKGI